VPRPALDTAELDEIVDGREINQRFTSNRAAIIETLRRAPNPITIPELLQARPDLAQSSVYRNLVVLEQAGLVHRIVTSDEFARFELAEEFTEHHHHLICSNCGSVQDVPTSPTFEHLLDEAVAETAAATGFDVRHHRLDLVGLCPDCH
jgi:Fur family ferric uptake transcriptional regulator